MLIRGMAVLWKKSTPGGLLEVRSAGHTRRLYADGVLHTQYNPNAPLTGDIWDSLSLSPGFAPRHHVQRVLVLGVGGGAALRHLQRYFTPELIVGVELDPIRISLAKRFFGLKRKGIELVCANAVEWLLAYSGEPFDLIIDDIFGQAHGSPIRFIPLHASWTKTLCAALHPRGILAVNTITPHELAQTALVCEQQYRRRFQRGFRFVHPQSENAIGVFSPFSTTQREFRSTVQSLEGLHTARARKLMQFRISSLW